MRYQYLLIMRYVVPPPQMGGRALLFLGIFRYVGLIIISVFDAAKIDKDNGQYYQIGIRKYAFLD
jgi:hypothetical protein